jgi:putative ABC transport system permease protein
METFWQDLRYSARLLRKQPAFTLVTALTLALGIGANSAIFSVVNAVLLRPLPFKEPDRIIKLWETFRPLGQSAEGQGTVSLLNLKDWRGQNDVFTGLAAFQGGSFNLQGPEQPERVPGAVVTPNLFEIMGAAPQMGRAFLEGEDEPGRHQVVVLSDALWRQHFGADPEIINKRIPIGGESFTVVGVMPPGFRFPSRATALWVPLVPTPEQANNRDSHSFLTIGRLKSGVTLEQAREQMRAISRRIEQQYPKEQTGRSVRLIPLQEETVQNVRQALWVLFGAVGFVLLIACTNVANLLLARASARRREIAIRSALGAGRGRLIRQFITESLLLAILGGAAALLLAKWSIDALLALASASLPRAHEVTLDGQVMWFTLLLSLLTGVVFGLAPALQLSKTDVQESLKESGSAGSNAQRTWLRSALVVAEVAAAMVLLIGAGLLIKSFARLQETESGLRPENVLTMSIALPQAKYATPQAINNFYQQAIDRISALPGVQTAGAISLLPIQQTGYNGSIQIEGEAPHLPGQEPIIEYRTITPDYFRAMGIPLVAGRFFTVQDHAQAERVMIINQTLARRFFADQNPIGKRISTEEFNWMTADWKTIVGVVADVKQSGLIQAVSSEIYTPHAQSSAAGMNLVVRAMAEPAPLAEAIRREVQTVDPAQPIYNVKTMETVIADSISNRRLNMLLLGIFASVALLLAVIGIYSVMSYTVTQSTREIGIRMALGAQPGNVLKLVLGHGLVLALTGVGLGVAGALGLTQLMATLLYNVTATDPLTFVVVSALLLAVALLACYVPARRATKVDPMVALRYE